MTEPKHIRLLGSRSRIVLKRLLHKLLKKQMRPPVS
jgi:hypothetical protein